MSSRTALNKFGPIGVLIVGILAVLLNSFSQMTPTQPQPIVSPEVQGVAEIAEVSPSPSPTAPTHQPVTFRRVIDGDTVEVELNGQLETIRVIGINTPETVDPRKSVECFGQEASQQAKYYFEQSGNQIWLEADSSQGERDKYQRLLRYIFTDDDIVDYGKVMIALGYANEYKYDTPYKYQALYQQAETEARDGKKGLWADDACDKVLPSPIPSPRPPLSKPSPVSVQPATDHNCSGPDLDCADFSTHSQAQAFFDGCGFTATNDPMRLDGTGVDDGIACESLP